MMATVILFQSGVHASWELSAGEILPIRDWTTLADRLAGMVDFAEMAWVHSHRDPRRKLLVGYLGDAGWAVWVREANSHDVWAHGYQLVRAPRDDDAPVFQPYEWTDFAGLPFAFETVHPEVEAVAHLMWGHLSGEEIPETYGLAPRDHMIGLPQHCASVAEALELIQEAERITLSGRLKDALLEFALAVEAYDVILTGAARFSARVPRSESRLQFQILERADAVRVSGLRGDVGGEYSMMLPSREILRTPGGKTPVIPRSQPN